MVSPFAVGVDVNVSVYNYSTSRVVVYLNYQWVCIMEPQEYRGFKVPWDTYQYFDFFRYPSGTINNAYRVQVSVGKYRPTEQIEITEPNLP